MLVCAFYVPFCTRDRGCSKHPAFPAPSIDGRNELQSPGETRRGNAEVCFVVSVVIVREGGRSSIPETLMVESSEPGVLDTRLRGYDSWVWARASRQRGAWHHRSPSLNPFLN